MGHPRLAAARAGVLALAACGAPTDAPTGATTDGADAARPGAADAATADALPPGWAPLAELPWALAPGGEAHACRRIALAEDVWITGLRGLTATGTHHTVLTLSAPDAPLGDHPCDRGNTEPRVLYAAGADADELDLPDGVALHLRAGQRLDLGLHALNPSNDPRAAVAGVLARAAAPADVVHEAEVVLLGRQAFEIPAHATGFEVTGGCVATEDAAVFAALPIMRRLGAYQRATATGPAGVAVLYDGLHAFGEERLRAMAPVAVHAGDALEVTCSFDNVTSAPVASGPGPLDEACATSLLRYPATGGDPYACVR